MPNTYYNVILLYRRYYTDRAHARIYLPHCTVDDYDDGEDDEEEEDDYDDDDDDDDDPFSWEKPHGHLTVEYNNNNILID